MNEHQQTGRTTRMIEDARRLATEEHRAVYIIVSSPREQTRIRALVGEPDHGIRVEIADTIKDFDWIDLHIPGSRTSSRQAFLDAVGASTFVVSSGPVRYGSVVLPDADVITELTGRGQVFRTDLADEACRVNPAKIGPDADDKAGGCDNIRITIPIAGPLQIAYWRDADE
jgi:hypothetical protein